MKNESPKRVGIWIRVSTEDQVRGESPEHHEKRARLYAEAKGWTIVTVYQLNAVSGKTVKDTPEAKRMLADVREGHIQGLIFSKLARLARNTRELLDFAEYFRQHDAELISLGESIDTSSPAGRLFYTMIAAMATWERDEIASRVAASVPIRARLGKPLGGAAPFGYAWIENTLVVDEKEATVRRLMYDLYLEHLRFKTVARILNERGFRTRKGEKFSDTTVNRLLSDPIAGGTRRVNCTQAVSVDGHWKRKPKDEWVDIPAPAIISKEQWELVNATLTQNRGKSRKKSKRVTHLFSGVTECHCGGKMYVPSTTPKYLCRSCKNRIPVGDLEAVFQEQIRNFFFSPDEIAKQLSNATASIRERESLLGTVESEIRKISSEIDKLYDLYQSDAIDKAGFSAKYRPLVARKSQIEEELPALQAELDTLKIAQLSQEEIVVGAKDLYSRWFTLAHEEKRRIVEAITERIVVGDGDITIDLLYEPASMSSGGGFGGGSSEGGTGSPPGSPLNGMQMATNPCPDGYFGSNIAARPCRCTPDQIARYRSKISGPLLDRIDLQITVPTVATESLRAAADGESSAAVRVRVIAAADRQQQRQKKANADLSSTELDVHCALDEQGSALLQQAATRLGLSARAQHRILRVARTIADLAGADRIAFGHIAEAVGYRRMDT